MQSHIAGLLVGVLFGVLLQRSRFCYASLLTDAFLFRATRIGRGVVVATLGTMLGWSAIYAIRGSQGFWLPAPGGYSLIGGVVFGIGMVTAGACITSTLFRVGSGQLRYVLTLLAMGVGYLGFGLAYPWLVEYYFVPLWWRPGTTLFESALVPAPVVALGVSTLVVLAYAAVIGHTTRVLTGDHRRRVVVGLEGLVAGGRTYVADRRGQASRSGLATISHRIRRPYDPRTAGLGIAVLATAWLWVNGVWTVSGPESQWVLLALDSLGVSTPGVGRWTSDVFGGQPSVTPGMVLIAGILAGSFLAALWSDEFRLERPAHDVVPYAVAGGLLMGVGSRLAPGCNVAALFTGVASLSLHGLLTAIGIIAGAYAATRLIHT